MENHDKCCGKKYKRLVCEEKGIEYLTPHEEEKIERKWYNHHEKNNRASR